MSMSLKRFIWVCLLRCLMALSFPWGTDFLLEGKEWTVWGACIWRPRNFTFSYCASSTPGGTQRHHILPLSPPSMRGPDDFTYSCILFSNHVGYLGTVHLFTVFFLHCFQCTRSITFFFYTNSNTSPLIESFCPCSWSLHQDTFMMRSKRNLQHPDSETVYSHYNSLTEVCLQFGVRRTACCPKTAPEDLQFSFQKLLILNTIYFLNFPLKLIV